MKKLIKYEDILYKSKRPNFTEIYKWGEVKKILSDNKIELQDDDILVIQYEESYEHGDSSRDDCYSITVRRLLEESDEDFEKRKNKYIKLAEESKKNRYKNYLELKKEFETE